ncbi:hypothetical protein FA15DRAFT_658495 [Coprinopsis marcescibilis]|uniref:TRP C-terminal domain-containing protein n=1 Tax=Coprinopsis marcescibilis TaxID=230819 RepID=A0A5C3KLM8_COPMA|nr:hypothetical protein FA15DRAFT_658495 [Coprinopsis marcescibilis]
MLLLLSPLLFPIIFLIFLTSRRVSAQPPSSCSISALNRDLPDLYEAVSDFLGDNEYHAWCAYWIGACTYYSYYCPLSTASCSVWVTVDQVREDLTCYVDVSSFLVPPNAFVPRDSVARASPDLTYGGADGGGPRPGGEGSIEGSGPSIGHVPIPPFQSATPLESENTAGSNTVLAVTAILIAGGAVGAAVALNIAPVPTGISSAPATDASGNAPMATSNGAQHSSTVAKTPVVTDAVDPVLLLLHFQFISSTGFLSLAYPLRYLGYTYHFSFANFLSPLLNSSLVGAMGGVCYYPGSGGTEDARIGGGFLALAHRYGLPPGILGGMVNLGVVIAFSIALGVVGLISIFALLFKNSTNGALRSMGTNWPSMASNISLRMCLWVWGTVATFSFYQFFFPCPISPSLAISAVNFCVILLALLTVSILILRTAKEHGVEKMYSTEEDESPYARRWGSVYAGFKQSYYRYFIADYVWIFGRSMITAFAQEYQKEDYATAIIAITATYACALGMNLVFKAAVGIINWLKDRRQPGSDSQ